MEQTLPFHSVIKEAKSLGISERKFLDNIDSADFDGPLIFSSDSNEAGVKGILFKINNVDELKHLAGNPDEFYDNGSFENHHEIPPPYSRETMRDIALNMPYICAAHDAYLFGDSKSVASYRDVLNKVYYPLTINVYILKGTLNIRAGHPLIVKTTPALVAADTINVEKGSYIQWAAVGGKLVANLFALDVPPQNPAADIDAANAMVNTATNLATAKCNPIRPPTFNYGSIGKQGACGVNGAPAACMGIAGQGSLSISGKSSCDTPAGVGHTGLQGAPGNPGNPGGRGADSEVVNASLGKIAGTITLASRGGDGGPGGDGSKGGKGQQGGPGGTKSTHCSQGPGGPGGPGGTGGTAGPGGHGGDGKNVYITYVTGGNPQFKVAASGTSLGGLMGGRGGGGDVGDGGVGNPMGGSGTVAGTEGAVAPDGLGGKAGEFIINGRKISPNT